jgi:hypothetical protein
MPGMDLAVAVSLLRCRRLIQVCAMLRYRGAMLESLKVRNLNLGIGVNLT